MPPPGRLLARLVDERVASRLAAGELAAARPGWLTARRLARPVGGQIVALHGELRAAGVVRTLLVTAGGAGINAAALVPGEPRLIVLDTPDAGRVAEALAGDLTATVLVVSVPPGVDRRGIDAVTAAVQHALRAEGIDARERTVAVVPPDAAAPEAATVIRGPADVHDAWTAFTPYALVPGGVAGADVRMLLGPGVGGGAKEEYGADAPDNPALVLGALLAGADAVELPDADEALVQLVTALGRGGPRPVERPHTEDALTISTDADADVRTSGYPTGQLNLWHHAVAAAGYLLGVDPTDPPAPAAEEPGEPAFVDGDVAVHAGRWLPAGTTTVAGALRALLDSRPGPVALHAHLDREADASAAVLRGALARRARRTTTFTWAPGRPPVGGLTVQLTGGVPQDVPGELAAVAAVPGPGAEPDGLRLHLHDRLTGLITVTRAVQELEDQTRAEEW